MITTIAVNKTFALHRQDAAIIAVLPNLSLSVQPGASIVLRDPARTGTSMVLRKMCSNRLMHSGEIIVERRRNKSADAYSSSRKIDTSRFADGVDA